MNLRTLFQHLATGEMRAYSYGKDLLKKDIPEKTLIQVISNINLGLEELHRKFLLSKSSLILKPVLSKSTFVLNSSNAQSKNVNDPTKYIVDTTDDPFSDDLVRVLQVWHESGYQLPLNTPQDPNSAFLLSYNTIQIPLAKSGVAYEIIYQSKPKEIVYSPHINIDSIEINIDPKIKTALLYFIGSRIHINLNKAHTMSEANFFSNRYQSELQNIPKTSDMNINVIKDISLEGWI